MDVFQDVRTGKLVISHRNKRTPLTREQLEELGGPEKVMGSRARQDFDRRRFDDAYRRLMVSYDEAKFWGMPPEFLNWMWARNMGYYTTVTTIWQRCPNDEWLLELAAYLNPAYFDHVVGGLVADVVACYGNNRDAVLAADHWRVHENRTAGAKRGVQAALHALDAQADGDSMEQRSGLRDLVMRLGRELGVPVSYPIV